MLILVIYNFPGSIPRQYSFSQIQIVISNRLQNNCFYIVSSRTYKNKEDEITKANSYPKHRMYTLTFQYTPPQGAHLLGNPIVY